MIVELAISGTAISTRTKKNKCKKCTKNHIKKRLYSY